MYSTSKKVKYPTQKKRVYATGEGSLLTLHRDGTICHGAFLMGQYIEKRSDWDKGRSFKVKGVAEIAEQTGYSTRHVRRCLKELQEVGWLKQVSEPGAEYLQFEIYPFGEDARKDRQTTAAPLDDTDPLARLGAGEISRSECIAWHYANVGWQERLGESVPQSLREWAQLTGLSARKLWEVFKESRLFQRISTKTHATVVKVFPFLEAPSEPKADPRALSDAEIQASYSEVIFADDGTARYRGEQYRQSGIGFEYWKAVTQRWIFTLGNIPEAVKTAFGERELKALTPK